MKTRRQEYRDGAGDEMDEDKRLLFDAGVTYLNPAEFPTGFLCVDMVASKEVNQVERVALITVESTFSSASAGHSDGRRLIIHPDLSVPPAGWNERTETVTILTPEGREFEATATFCLSHINIKDPRVSIDQRWRVIVCLQGMTSDSVPVGSKIFVSRETRDALLPPNSGRADQNSSFASKGLAVRNPNANDEEE